MPLATFDFYYMMAGTEQEYIWNMELARWFSYIYIYFTNKAGYRPWSHPIVFTLYMYQGLVTKHMLYTYCYVDQKS